MSMTADRNFLSGLLDLSFTEFITLKIIKWLYLMAILGVALLGLFVVLAGFAQGLLMGLGSLIVVALFGLVAITVIRVWLEAAVVFFRIADNTTEITEQSAAIAVSLAKGTNHSDRAHVRGGTATV